MGRNATLDQIKSYRQGVTTALLDQHRRKGLGMNAHTPAPILHEASASIEPVATPAQRSYLADLLTRLQRHAPSVHADAMAWINNLHPLTRTDASRAIDAVKRHLACPAEVVPAQRPTNTAGIFAEVRIALENVPSDARYALEVGENDWRFYKIYMTASGSKVVQVGHADGYGMAWERLSAASQLKAALAIAEDPREAMLNFGRKIGQCGHCGRTLTNQSSREAGIGPVCAAK